MCRVWREYDVAGIGGGLTHLAVDTASKGSPPLLEVRHTHTHTASGTLKNKKTARKGR